MNKKIKISNRNYFEALNHVLNQECIPAFKILCRLLQEEKNMKKEIQINRRAAGRGYGYIPILKRALLCLLCVRVYNIFADKRGMSLKKLGTKLRKEKIIIKMLETRSTWFGHISKQINDIVSAEEICASNLLKIFEDMSDLLTDLYLKRIILKKIIRGC